MIRRNLDALAAILNQTLQIAAPALIVIGGTLAILIAMVSLLPRALGLQFDVQVIGHEYGCTAFAVDGAGETITLHAAALSSATLVCPTIPAPYTNGGRRYTFAAILVSREGGAFYRLNLTDSKGFLQYPVGAIFSAGYGDAQIGIKDMRIEK